ncbi:SulP family inorganic anion transporter [Sporosarcina thermotolerans]|uniref:SulP family inorganic anion transporter n=1 Tax=Sporosarcina thermotolerans TaxID=633404 RepID=A0AAW9A7A3_9BACL|nr:SulP family inorganic anion transporter [Sporosarcina thermotolerans]MDW0116889.1 SulP family inorganic anion transporter [Sporosarcina thermotolerans]
MFKDQRFVDYNAAGFRKDLLSGITVGIVAIPLGMAFAIASGVKPEYGLYTTIIAGFLVALFGGSRFQIAGPTGAFIPILLAIVLQYGYEDLLIAGFLAGIFLVIMSYLGVSNLIHFVPRSVTIGFTSGIAIIIFTGQFGNFLGLSGLESKEFFHENMIDVAKHLHTINIFAVLTAVIGLSIIFILPKLAPKLPVLLVALLIPTIISVLLFPGKVETIGTAFGGIPQTLPGFHFPQITLTKLLNLWQPALIIAALGAIESLLSAVVADGMKEGPKHDSKRELFGQGIANIVSPLFGGIPATGAIARTATNIRSGAVGPVSGIVQSVFVLLFLLLFAPYASYIPLAAMAPILMFVAWNMSARKSFVHILSVRSSDSIVLVTTFLLTIFINLTVAVQIGILLAALSFLRKMSGKLNISVGKLSDVEIHKFGEDVTKFIFDGPLFFGSAKTFEDKMPGILSKGTGTIILDFEHLSMIDATGEAALFTLLGEAKKKNVKIIIKKLPKQKLAMFKKSGLYDRIGEENFFM